jgi:hypothetical protein
MITVVTQKKQKLDLSGLVTLRNKFVMETDKAHRFIQAIKDYPHIVDIDISESFTITNNIDLAIAALNYSHLYD